MLKAFGPEVAARFPIVSVMLGTLWGFNVGPPDSTSQWIQRLEAVAVYTRGSSKLRELGTAVLRSQSKQRQHEDEDDCVLLMFAVVVKQKRKIERGVVTF